MSISFAGLSIVSLQNPFTELAGMVIGKSDVRTILCLSILCIILLVLAYLTNPSESSFRSYLIEQSFRQHLSRLDETCEDSKTGSSSGVSRLALTKSSVATPGHILPVEGILPFHFANRAAISLRTPKHVFHGFGIFTVAAMIPLARSPQHDGHQSLKISDSWYIGAFGKWWRGGILEAWYHDVISRSKDEESWSSGILSMKSLDMLDYPSALSRTTNSNPFVNGSLQKLRNRDRPLYRNNVVPSPRSTTPPPLLKSESLPLHTTRVLPTPDRPLCPIPQSLQAQNPPSSNTAEATNLPPSQVSLTLFDQSPRIAQVLDQIAASKTSIVDLRAQLEDYQTSASQSHAAFSIEVDTYRKRKRDEDAARLETKLRTKTLEDSKRTAEGLKRDIEKKLKVAKNAHEQAKHRIQSLDKEITRLQQETCDDGEAQQRSHEEASLSEKELADELEQKKHEVKTVEDTIVTLNQRARVLEDELKDEIERLRTKRNMVQGRRANISQSSLHDVCQGSTWPSVIHDQLATVDEHPPYQLRPTLNTNIGNSLQDSPPDSPFGSYLDQSSQELAMYGDDGVAQPFGLPNVSSPTSQSLIPSGLMTFIDNAEGPSPMKSFHSDGERYLERDWPHSGGPYHHQLQDSSDLHSAYDTIPTMQGSQLQPSVNDVTEDGQFGSGSNSPSDTVDFPSSYWSPFQSSANVPEPLDPSPGSQDGYARRWFHLLKDKPKKGLNPDAKEFSFSKNSLFAPSLNIPSFDNLNPNGLKASTPSSTSTGDSLLRAFALSPAEREALQRVLGAANTSFERLPSLSDVRSIPSSPSHVPALPVSHGSQISRKLGNIMPSWPHISSRDRKSSFSPWGDEEVSKSASISSGMKENRST